MADLGTIDALALQSAKPLRGHLTHLGFYTAGFADRFSIDGAINGLALDKFGDPAPGALALLYTQYGMHHLLARTRSASDGTFSFPGRDSTGEFYVVVAFPPPGSTEDAVVHARLTAEP